MIASICNNCDNCVMFRKWFSQHRYYKVVHGCKLHPTSPFTNPISGETDYLTQEGDVARWQRYNMCTNYNSDGECEDFTPRVEVHHSPWSRVKYFFTGRR